MAELDIASSIVIGVPGPIILSMWLWNDPPLIRAPPSQSDQFPRRHSQLFLAEYPAPDDLQHFQRQIHDALCPLIARLRLKRFDPLTSDDEVDSSQLRRELGEGFRGYDKLPAPHNDPIADNGLASAHFEASEMLDATKE